MYVLANYSQLQTYDVDPTGRPTAEGEPINFGNGVYSVVPSLDDHFIYVVDQNINATEFLYVYATDFSGAPQQIPIQTLNVRKLVYFEIAPNGKFAYAIESNFDSHGYTLARVREFTVDPITGLLSPTSQVVASFLPNGPCGTAWSVNGWLQPDGFSLDGSTFYDDWYCTSHDSIEGSYYAYPVEVRTGHLGVGTNVFHWVEDDSADGVWFTPTSLIDNADPAGVYGDAAVSFYPSNGGQLIFSCNSQMLEACGSGYGATPDSFGQFIFLQASADFVQIGKIDLPNKTIIDTGNYIPQQMVTISPDRLLIYTQVPNQSNPYYLPIYVFDPAIGSAQEGGTITVSSASYSLVPALRQ